MKPVVLKGRKEGYEVLFNDLSDFETCLSELNSLLKQIAHDQPEIDDNTLQIVLKTENRLLHPDQEDAIRAIIEQFPQFSLKKIESSVISKQTAKDLREKDNIHIETSVLRSGQEVQLNGDILFLGNLHQGAILKTTGSIYILGKVEGIVHAGFPDNNDAIIIGDLSNVKQIRISDVIEIVDHEKQSFTSESVTYINDLHILSYDTLSNLKNLRPKLYYEMEEKR